MNQKVLLLLGGSFLFGSLGGCGWLRSDSSDDDGVGRACNDSSGCPSELYCEIGNQTSGDSSMAGTCAERREADAASDTGLPDTNGIGFSDTQEQLLCPEDSAVCSRDRDCLEAGFSGYMCDDIGCCAEESEPADGSAAGEGSGADEGSGSLEGSASAG